MQKFIKDHVVTIGMILSLWALFSIAASIIKVGERTNTCGKTYPIDYVLYTNLFCEIKP